MKRVLLVDDEFALTDSLKEFLEDEGYDVECAGNGQEALQRMASKPPDIVISDLMMPIMDGHAMLQAMRARPDLKSIPVVLSSSVRNTGLPRDGLLEFSAVLRKPFQLGEFLELVKGLTSAKEPTHSPPE